MRKIRYILCGVFVAAFIAACPVLFTNTIQAQAKDNGNLTFSDRVEQIYNEMSLDERITQTFMVQTRTWNYDGENKDMTTMTEDLKQIYQKYKPGGFISFECNMKDTSEIVQLSKDLQQSVKEGQQASGSPEVPMIITTDQEGGRVNRVATGTPMPGNMAVYATRNLKNSSITSSIISQELSVLGYNSTLAPDFDVNNNAGNPVIATRSFSDDPYAVGEYGCEYINGLKTKNTIGTIKHFPGHGDTKTDSHTGCPVVDKSWSQLCSNELIPFYEGIQSNVESVMLAHIIYPQIDSSKIIATKGKHKGEEVGTPTTLSYKWVTQILKGNGVPEEGIQGFNFKGVVTTDSMEMAGVASILENGERDLMALQAGVDFLCMPFEDKWKAEDYIKQADEVIAYLRNAYYNDQLTEDRLHDAVCRVLTLKEEKGILDSDASTLSEEKALEVVGNAEFRDAERDMAADAVTVVKNENDFLPIDLQETNGKNVLFLIQNSLNIVDQSTTITEQYEGPLAMAWNRVKAAWLVPSDVNVSKYVFDNKNYTVEGKMKEAIDNADIVIVDSNIRSEEDMACEVTEETKGAWKTAGVKNATDYCRENGKKSVVISINVPYDTQLYPNADAIMAVYGSKGCSAKYLSWDETLSSGATLSQYAFGCNIVAGVEVAFGVYGAQGKLSVNIPKYDFSTRKYTDNIVYKRGYGICYDAIPNVDLSKAKITLEYTKADYTGEALTPKVTATMELEPTPNSPKKVNIKTLEEGKHYTLGYENNVDPGTATAQITGVGRYFGTQQANYEIVGQGGDVPSIDEDSTSTDISKTGDSLWWLWILIAIIVIALAVIIIVTILNKKSKNKGSHTLKK